MPTPSSWSGNYTSGRLKGKSDFIRIGIPIRAPMGLIPGGGITHSLTDTGNYEILFSRLRITRLAIMNQSIEMTCSASMRPSMRYGMSCKNTRISMKKRSSLSENNGTTASMGTGFLITGNQHTWMDGTIFTLLGGPSMLAFPSIEIGIGNSFYLPDTYTTSAARSSIRYLHGWPQGS